MASVTNIVLSTAIALSAVETPVLDAVNAPTQVTTPIVTQYSVTPRSTDPAIDDWLQPHQAYIASSVPKTGYLFVFLPGSFGWANGQDLLQNQAAENGYHGITMRYPNRWTVNDMCGTDTDPDCFEKVRMEIIDGKDRTPKVSITRANSIENRLIKLLQYLDRTHPGEGWGKYLGGDTIKWGMIIIAGHSQGSGHAAMIARVHKVARVVMFGGPTDFNRRTLTLAPWLSASHATPTSSYYAFNHEKDMLFQRESAWKALGMDVYGHATNVNNSNPPYGGSHELVTAVQTNNPHSSVVVDAVVPTRNGVPVFRDAWEYLCFNVPTTSAP